MTKSDLIEEFNQSCIGLAAFMDDYLDEFPDGEIVVTIPFLNTQMDDIDDVWWDEGNIAKQISFFNSLNQASQIMHTEVGHLFLNNHKDRFEKRREQTGFFKHVQHIFPHMVGIGESKYGGELRSTNGFETLEEVCNTLPEVQLSVWLVPNPEAKTLESAFMLAAQFNSSDKKPLRSKIEHAGEAGLFKSVRQHYGLT